MINNEAVLEKANPLGGEALSASEADETPQMKEGIALAKKWGWDAPTVDVINVALMTSRMKKMAANDQLGDYLVEEAVISASQCEEYRAIKPTGMRELEFLIEREPKAAHYSDRFLAASSLTPFYDLQTLNVIYDLPANVIEELDHFDALVAQMDTDDSYVIVFGNYAQLSRFRTLGRGDRMRNAIISDMIGDESTYHLALSDPLAISQILREIGGGQQSMAGVGRQANHWSVPRASPNVLREERDLARLIDYCISEDINDIALTPDRTGGYKIRVRRYGDMTTPKAFPYFPPEIADKVKRFLLTRSGANPSQASRISEPLDGSITYSSSVGSTFMRCSFIPTNHRGDMTNATSVSLRLLPQGARVIRLEGLNLPEQVRNDVRTALRISSGLIVVVGPTNSGKSTTIAGAINEHIDIFGERKKRLTLEDPIERFLEGLTQFEPSGGGSDTDRFERMLRAFKRHDPDAVWVGEVRDRATAELCVDTSSSGHLVLTTLHANDTVTGLDLLGRMVPSTKTFQLIESISLIISQRLVKTVCPHCSSMASPSDEEVAVFNSYLERMEEADVVMPEKVPRPNLEGCEHCYEGYDGQRPINESLPMTRRARDAAIGMVIQQKAQHGQVAKFRTVTMLDSAIEMVNAGRVELMSILT
jgi:type II secretory ATPase GspE/PulE/Tfp pilus assembly ATPase PilB-like protein